MNFKSEHLNLEACLFHDCKWLVVNKKVSPLATRYFLECSCVNCEKDCPCYEDQLHYQEIYKDYFGGNKNVEN